jgi:hypothetical protein
MNNSTNYLQKILVRFYPPGIILEIADQNYQVENKVIDLLNLTQKFNIFIKLVQI